MYGVAILRVPKCLRAAFGDGLIARLGSAHLKEFFFVPYFDACVHVPPPPPNQRVYVTLDKRIPVPEMWTSYWLRGELAVEISKNEMADSAYTMKEATLQPYEG